MDLKAWTQAQTAVIGALLLEPDKVSGMIFAQARPEHFGDPALRHVFEAARGLWNERKAVDAVTVLGAAGGEYEPLLADCMRLTPTVRNTEIYLGLIRDAAKLNAIQTAALAISTATDLESAAAAYEDLGSRLRDMDGFEDRTLEELIERWCDRMNDKKPVDYLRFGIEQLDGYLNVVPGDFVILAADSSVGKTALALQMAYSMAESGKKVGFFSLETGADKLTDRLLAEVQTAAVDLPRSKKKQLRDEDWKAVTAVALRDAAKRVRILNKFRTVEQIRGRAIMRGFDVIFVDYVQLLDAKGENRPQMVTEISIGLHRLAQELGVTVIGLSQITPPSKDRKTAPSKDDLRESRQLKHDGDVILILSISNEGAGVFRELQVAKNKDGPCGRMLLDFDPEHMTFKYRPPETSSEVGRQLRAEGRRVKRRAIDGQGTFRELAEGEGGDLPF